MRSTISVILMLLVTLLQGQVEHIGRFETTYDWSTEDFVVIPNGDNGVMIAQAQRRMRSSEFTAVFTHLNNDLEVEWSDSLQLDKSLIMKGYAYNGIRNYILLQDRSVNRDLKIVRVDPANNSITEYEPRRLTEIEVTDFEVIKNSAVIAGYVENRPAAFVYDMDTEKLVTLNNVYQNNSELLEIKINADSLTFNVVASVLDEKRDKTVLINTYDYVGNPIRDYQLVTQEDHQLMTAVSSSIFNIEQLVIGLYNYKVGTSPSGFYINHVDRTGQQTMNYVPFGKLETFFEHEGEKREAKMKEKSLKWHERNKAYRYKTEALFRKMIEEDDELVIFAEFYKPWATTSYEIQNIRRRSNPYYYANGRSIMPNSSFADDPNFGGPRNDEYEFTHAFALSLDKSGNLLWDANYEIDEDVEGYLTSYGEFLYHNENAYYAHYTDEELIIEHLNKQDEEKEVLVTTLDLLGEKDELRYERDDFGGMIHWHDDKYIVYGIHHVRPSDRSEPLRKVFFVNAISIGPDFPVEKGD